MDKETTNGDILMDSWKLMVKWHLVLPPSRPSLLQLSRIRYHIADLPKSCNVAILGSTPEFRDLLFECGFKNIYVFERNIDFYKQMTEYRAFNNKEILIKGDWLNTLDNYTNCFHLILSDLTSGNVPYESRKKFYSSITNSLVTGGGFFDKVLTHEIPNLLISELEKKYDQLPINLITINNFNCEMLFCSELLEISQKVDTSLFYQILEKKIRSPKVLRFLEECKNNITPCGFTWWYGKSWNTIKKTYCVELKPYMVFDEEETSPYYLRAKLFFLRKS